MKIPILLNYTDIDEWPSDSIAQKNLYMWNTNLTKIIENEFGENWNEYKMSAYEHYGKPGNIKKNPLTISRALKSAWDNNSRSDLLTKLVGDIVDFAKNEYSSKLYSL